MSWMDLASRVAKRALEKVKERKWLDVLATLGALEEVSIDKWLSLQGHEGLITKNTRQDSVEDTRLTVLDYLLYHELPQSLGMNDEQHRICLLAVLTCLHVP